MSSGRTTALATAGGLCQQSLLKGACLMVMAVAIIK
jgi:hypothetical protein